ncbi:MAG: bifunctional riboflavin kinase/FAD synthetase [Candidatus Rokubacteria bacterium]|nr:bifunctional riboflavin kinase/FAD synthetase [Candidatus Rokubacteria bacterium]
MWIVRGLESYPPDAPPVVAALGIFDGVHLAHRAILATAVERGRDLRVPSIACTFDPHPTEVLQPDRAPRPISTLDERLELIASTGVDGALVLRFTRELAVIEAEAFVRDVLAGRLKVREVVVGYNHTFGRGARGNVTLLAELGDQLGFRVHVTPPFEVDGVPVSSTAIRAALQSGNVEGAARLLGRAYTVNGQVVQGAGRGRTLGFPTANLALDRPLLARSGVYACDAEMDGATWQAVVNVGVRPTFGEDRLAVEAHVLDFAGELYGRRIRVAFLRRLRDESRFPSVDALRQQIASDVASARRLRRG